VILNEPTSLWRAIAVFLSEAVRPERQIGGNLTPKIKVLGWPSDRDVVCAYHRPGEAGDVGEVSRAVVRKLRKILGQSTIRGSGRSIGVVRDLIGGRNLRS
jgi:hypothetical protein